MTAEATTTSTSTSTPSGSKRGALLSMVALVALGVGLRLFFVDALTKVTGTWMGGVESPHRSAPAANPDANPAPKGPSAA